MRCKCAPSTPSEIITPALLVLHDCFYRTDCISLRCDVCGEISQYVEYVLVSSGLPPCALTMGKCTCMCACSYDGASDAIVNLNNHLLVGHEVWLLRQRHLMTNHVYNSFSGFAKFMVATYGRRYRHACLLGDHTVLRFRMFFFVVVVEGAVSVPIYRYEDKLRLFGTDIDSSVVARLLHSDWQASYHVFESLQCLDYVRLSECDDCKGEIIVVDGTQVCIKAGRMGVSREHMYYEPSAADGGVKFSEYTLIKNMSLRSSIRRYAHLNQCGFFFWYPILNH